MLRRPIEGARRLVWEEGRRRRGTRGKERTKDESKRTRGKLRKARRGEGQYKACRKETSAVTIAVKSSKRMGRIKKRKKTHISVIQRICEQDRVPRPGGLVGLVLGDGFGAVEVVFLGYDG